MSLENKTVLVTGANGFIGSWLCKRLVEEKADVIALVLDKERLSALLETIKAKIELVEADITDIESIGKCFSKKVDYCVHLAAIAEVEPAENAQEKAFEVNVQGTNNLLEKCVENNMKNFVFSSTVKVYGTQEGVITEKSKLCSSDIYGQTKINAEKIVEDFQKKYKFNAVILRQANIFGEYDLNTRRVIPNTIIRFARGQDALIKANTNTVRDFLYIKDLIDLYVIVLEFMSKKRDYFDIFNITCGTSVSILEIIAKIAELMNKKSKTHNEEKMEKVRITFSNKKARNVLNWQPKIALEEGLKKTIEYYRGIAQETF